MISRIFIDRPVFAWVIAIVIMLAGLGAIRTLPVEQYPDIAFEEVIIDANAMQLNVRGELTTTTATEFRLLDYLARHPGRVFSRDHLLDSVWGDARFVTPRSVDVYVRRIREKIEVDPENPRYLKTVRGAGYRFELPKGD